MQSARGSCSGRFAVGALAALIPCAEVSQLRPEPAVPLAGTLFTLRPAAGQAGQAGQVGLPVIAAAPIDSVDGATITVRCSVGSAPGDTSSASLRVRTRPGPYRVERLRVAPRFGAEPDSALRARLDAEAALAAAVSRRSRMTPPLWSGAFAPPRTGRITSRFGGSRVFNGAVVSRHMGLDYAGAVGAPVRAVSRGIVRLVDRFFLGGNVIYLDHGEGLVTAYLHLSRQLVQPGDTVRKGQVIGHVGATGRVTGPHLHLIARLDSVSVDPASLIGRSFGR